MTTTPEGIPCWYELGTSDLTAASAFYADVLGWTIADAGMPGMDYRLGTATDGGMVSGMMALEGGQAAPPPYWLIYFTTEDCDARVAAITEAGGTSARGTRRHPRHRPVRGRSLTRKVRGLRTLAAAADGCARRSTRPSTNKPPDTGTGTS
jgi:predicted enzyme related to lactoylglutathione lyase